MAGCKSFQKFLSDSRLVDLGATGSRYTWKRDNLHVRLDRALANAKWISSVPNAIVMHLPRIDSDLRPLLINFQLELQPPQHHFRFLASWTSHPDFKGLMGSCWDHKVSLAENIANFTMAVQTWNTDIYGSLNKNKKKLRARLGGIQRALERTPFSTHLLELEWDILKQYHDLCFHEELLWLQKSRSQWITMVIETPTTIT